MFPVDRPAWLITPDAGNHEFGRLFYHDGKYTVRHGFDRVGGNQLLHAEILGSGFLQLRWNHGRTQIIPDTWFQMTFRA